MCHANGSLDLATTACPMCKVFRPPGASRCPHIREVCHNRSLHPRIDVVYLRNAEVQTFVGCGYCKFARANPKVSVSSNPGWPGCCRPPAPHEHRLIGPADWPTVSVIHHIPIPPEVKAVLDNISPASGHSPRHSPAGSLRGPSQSSQSSMGRRGSSHNSSRGESASARTAPMPIPSRARSGGSPHQSASSLTTSSVHLSGGGDSTSSSLPNSSAMEQYTPQRRSVDLRLERRPDSSNDTRYSPGRRHAELSVSISRKSNTPTPNSRSPPPTAPPPTPFAKDTYDAQSQRRRSTTNVSSTAATLPRSSARQSLGAPPRKSLEEAFSGMNLSSASSNSSGSNSETTVISDGAFTDYLSDESDAELQRQAELKAAQIAQNQAEELEFRAARQQLAHVDLRPPNSWTSNVSATPRG